MRKDIMRFLCAAIALLVLGGVGTIGCSKCSSGIVDPSCNSTETFLLVVPPSPNDGSSISFSGHAFTVSNNGEYFVTLNTLTPPLAGNLGTHVQVTAQAGGQCVPNLQKVNEAFGTAGKQILSGVFTQPGTYCVFVLDTLRTFPAEETASVTVNHP